MSIKKYGIYLALPPKTNLRKEEIGHYLGTFLRAAQERSDSTFVIAYPRRSNQMISQLLQDFEIQKSHFEVIKTHKKCILHLALFHMLGISLRLLSFSEITRFASPIFYKILGASHSSPENKSNKIMPRLIRYCNRHLSTSYELLREKLDIYRDNITKEISEREIEFLSATINTRTDIVAWYCPTAFWPPFNKIKAPRLMGVQNVAQKECPISFAHECTDRFEKIEKTIKEGDYFITHSEDVKWRTLVQRYAIDSNKVFAIPHCMTVNEMLKFSDSLTDNEETLNARCRGLLRDVLERTPTSIERNAWLGYAEAKFILYASQFRPHKNILTLLKAYAFLLQRGRITHKLILTGNPKEDPSLGIDEFIHTHNLQNDVLCLPELARHEHAACYKLADLAVNSSLSEGNTDTFTEALSVDTPVIMGRLPVNLEIIKGTLLDSIMLFDPYDWKDLANRIEWALKNKEELREKQKVLYNELAKRTWSDVVNDYVTILNDIATSKEGPSRLKEAA